MSMSTSADAALYYCHSSVTCSRIHITGEVSPRFDETKTATTHKEVLQQVVPVLLLSPSLESANDILGIVQYPLTFRSETGSAGGGTTTSLERV